MIRWLHSSSTCNCIVAVAPIQRTCLVSFAVIVASEVNPHLGTEASSVELSSAGNSTVGSIHTTRRLPSTSKGCLDRLAGIAAERQLRTIVRPPVLIVGRDLSWLKGLSL